MLKKKEKTNVATHSGGNSSDGSCRLRHKTPPMDYVTSGALLASLCVCFLMLMVTIMLTSKDSRELHEMAFTLVCGCSQ